MPPTRRAASSCDIHRPVLGSPWVSRSPRRTSLTVSRLRANASETVAPAALSCHDIWRGAIDTTLIGYIVGRNVTTLEHDIRREAPGSDGRRARGDVRPAYRRPA